MEAKSILTADLLDILFENRNKEYGAYQLRKTYNKRIRLALGSIFIVCILLGVITFFHQPPKTSEHQSLFVKDYQLAAIHDIQKEAIRLPPVARTVHQVAMARVTIPLIVRNVDVNPEDEPPINDQLDKIKIGIENNAGWGENNVPLPLEKSSTTMDIVTTRKNYDTQVFTVQVEAKFPGGTDAWSSYLQRNLRTEVPVENGAPSGSYTVIVSFLVDKDGNISEVRALNDPGYGTAGEAVRVIKKSEQWIPAYQNGHNVIYRQKQSITFMVQDQ